MTSAAQVGGSRSVPEPPPLVGRDDVLARLEALLEETVAGGGSATVAGRGPGRHRQDPGRRRAGRPPRRPGVDVLVGHCVAQGGQTLPYAPLVELLAELVRREGVAAVRRWAGPAAAELGRLVPALLEPGEEPAARGATGSSRLFQALSDACSSGLSSRRPLVLVVEDVHWADTSTRELLALLARQQPGDVLLLLTAAHRRVAGADRAWPGYVAELVAPRRAAGPARPAHPRRAGPPDQRHPRPPAAARELLDDDLRPRRGQPVLRRGAPGPRRRTPASSRPRPRPAAGPARGAAAGHPAGAAHRQPGRARGARTGCSRPSSTSADDRLEAALREAVEAHVLQPEGDGARLPARAAPGGHRRQPAARRGGPRAPPAGRDPDRVARRWPGRGTRGVAGRIARHWDAAGEPEQALVASVAAGQEACDALAFAESLAHYERALELLDVVPDGERLLDVPRPRLLRWAAEVAHLAAHPDLATGLVREAIDVRRPGRRHAARLAARAAGPLPLDGRRRPGRAGRLPAGRGAGPGRSRRPGPGPRC